MKTLRVKAKHLPPPPFSCVQESQVLLTLTNPVESITHVTLAACEEEDPDAVNSTARVLSHTGALAFPFALCTLFPRGATFEFLVFSDQVSRGSSWQQLHRLTQTDKLSESLRQLFQYPPDNLINVIAPLFF